MINYPNGKKRIIQDHVTDTSRRGMALETDINTTNTYYLDRDIAVIHKKPTPVQIVHVDYPERSHAKITEAYFKIPSTTDYNGVYREKYLDFEAKECASKTSFPQKDCSKTRRRHKDRPAPSRSRPRLPAAALPVLYCFHTVCASPKVRRHWSG